MRVEEVLAEAAGRGHLVDRPVGGADQAHVHRHRVVGADADDPPVLQGCEQLDLQRHRQVADLVEEQGAPGGDLEAAGAVAAGVGEGPLDVAEQLALEQGFAQGAHVDGDEDLAGRAASGGGSRAPPAPFRNRSPRG